MATFGFGYAFGSGAGGFVFDTGGTSLNLLCIALCTNRLIRLHRMNNGCVCVFARLVCRRHLWQHLRMVERKRRPAAVRRSANARNEVRIGRLIRFSEILLEASANSIVIEDEQPSASTLINILDSRRRAESRHHQGL